ncbi:hypothetical protein RPMA_12285 [Tardiphaga alba]|uniref:Uncharacterized protein n=1 Tax=Tardiphaga alba TaxID=340268 RepID=A0ABX8AB30_9BRAD|nr:hypothetical protein [Tardiphaga alba]QUS39525.1 hypothetical protein RPMA_12285 [Tardiphaga alba]
MLAIFTLASFAAYAGVGDQTPVVSETIRGDYQRLADCFYERVEKADTQTFKYVLNKNDLPSAKKSRISQGASYFKNWEATFSAAGPQSTNLEVSVTTSLWGPNRGWLDGVMPHVRYCASAEPLSRPDNSSESGAGAGRGTRRKH